MGRGVPCAAIGTFGGGGPLGVLVRAVGGPLSGWCVPAGGPLSGWCATAGGGGARCMPTEA